MKGVGKGGESISSTNFPDLFILNQQDGFFEGQHNILSYTRSYVPTKDKFYVPRNGRRTCQLGPRPEADSVTVGIEPAFSKEGEGKGGIKEIWRCKKTLLSLKYVDVI